MQPLVIDQPNTQLRIQDQQLRLVPEESSEEGARRLARNRVSLKQLDTLIVHPETQLSAKLLRQLTHAGVRTVCMDGRQMERSLIVDASKGIKSGKRRLQQYQLMLDEAARIRVASALIKAKTQAQQGLLRELPQQTIEVTQCLTHLEQGISAVRSAHSRAQLCGYEGTLQRHYFAVLFAQLPTEFATTQRSRRPPKDPANALLSLGYTLLYAEALGVIYQHGLDPYLGVFHQPEHGRYSLACDVMEPARVAVDRWVLGLLESRAITLQHISPEASTYRLNREGKAIFYAQYHQQKSDWRSAMAEPMALLLAALKRFPLPKALTNVA